MRISTQLQAQGQGAIKGWGCRPHHLAKVLELVLQAREEVAVIGINAHLPQLVVVGAVALLDAPLSVSAAPQA